MDGVLNPNLLQLERWCWCHFEVSEDFQRMQCHHVKPFVLDLSQETNWRIVIAWRRAPTPTHSHFKMKNSKKQRLDLAVGFDFLRTMSNISERRKISFSLRHEERECEMSLPTNAMSLTILNEKHSLEKEWNQAQIQRDEVRPAEQETKNWSTQTFTRTLTKICTCMKRIYLWQVAISTCFTFQVPCHVLVCQCVIWAILVFWANATRLSSVTTLRFVFALSPISTQVGQDSKMTLSYLRQINMMTSVTTTTAGGDALLTIMSETVRTIAFEPTFVRSAIKSSLTSKWGFQLQTVAWGCADFIENRPESLSYVFRFKMTIRQNLSSYT